MNLQCPSTCPVIGARGNPLGFPVGQIRRFGSAHASSAVAEGDVDETKRNVLKLLAVAGVLGAAGGGIVGGSLQYAQPPAVGLSSYPKVALVDVDGATLTSAKAMTEYNSDTADVLTFNYPLVNEPNFFLNLAPGPSGVGATNVLNGVGPQKSLVAFSAICQHLGCPAPAIHYYPSGTCPQTPGGKSFYIHCTCHGSTYDVTNGAAILTGPTVFPLPQVILYEAPDGTIFATGMTGPPVNGHLDTLKGSYGVGTTTPIVKQSPVPLCNFP